MYALNVIFRKNKLEVFFKEKIFNINDHLNGKYINNYPTDKKLYQNFIIKNG